ncbi:MAG TPA: lysozyme [Planctomycetota bacterium]|nr:lysozyme [Planctomycetota bacterium]
MGRIDGEEREGLGRDDYADREEEEPGILEQVRRIERGGPGIPKYGILAQADRIMRGLPGLPRDRGILAQGQRIERGLSGIPRYGILEEAERIEHELPGISKHGILARLRRAAESAGRPVEARLVATPEQIARARSKQWIVNKETNEATALPGATLWWLAWAITGDGNDYELLRFERKATRLKPGDTVNIMPLLRKAAGEPVKRKAGELRLSAKGEQFIKDWEELRLQPYHGRTGKRITRWIKGATIGYGHEFPEEVWPKFKDGVSEEEANRLFDRDISRFAARVNGLVKVDLKQHQFDALVALAFNIGYGSKGLAGSTVLKMINDPEYRSSEFKDLESAWKAYKKLNKEVNEGLINRRADEWEMFTKGDYRRDH